jgi:predicted TIM-barrel fold metal-dependent hydrolase
LEVYLYSGAYVAGDRCACSTAGARLARKRRRIIDPHVHVWKNDPAFPWASETHSPPSEDATPEMLLELMAAHGVEKTVLVQVIHYRWDNSYAAHALKQYPDKFMAVCRVNPEDPAAPDHLSRWTEEHGFHGVRLSPAADASGDWIRGPLMDPIFRRAAELGVPMLILTHTSRLTDVAALLERHTELDVVIDHMADADPQGPDEIQRLLDLARYPRVFVKISHTWSLSRQNYPWTDTHALVKQVYQTFGGQRIMWGTDWPVCLHRATYGQTLAVVRDEMTFFSPADREWVLGKTALRLWPSDQ